MQVSEFSIEQVFGLAIFLASFLLLSLFYIVQLRKQLAVSRQLVNNLQQDQALVSSDYADLQATYQEKQLQSEIQKNELVFLKQQLNEQTMQAHALVKKADALSENLKTAQIQLAESQAEKVSAEKAFAEKLALLEENKNQLKAEFKVLANDVLQAKQASMSEQSEQMLGGLMKPMQEAISQFKQRVEQVHKEDLEGRASLSEQLKQLQALNLRMSDEAKHLTKALKGDAKLQGNWGELILEKLLEASGLREGVEFFREQQLKDEEGKRFRPDVILNLPENKHVVIDSKVSLVHYEQAINTDNEDKQSFIKQHLASLKKHINALAEKRYDHLQDINSPDFVLMFVPIEGAYLLAIESDPSIFEDAFDKRVAVVTPTTLFTSLKTIEQLWRYERQSEHTLALIKRAADVHDKFVGFIDSFEKVGKQLSSVQNSYETAKKQLVSGSGNLVRQAEMLKQLAGKTKKELPKHLLEEAQGTSLLDEK